MWSFLNPNAQAIEDIRVARQNMEHIADILENSVPPKAPSVQKSAHPTACFCRGTGFRSDGVHVVKDGDTIEYSARRGVYMTLKVESMETGRATIRITFPCPAVEIDDRLTQDAPSGCHCMNCMNARAH